MTGAVRVNLAMLLAVAYGLAMGRLDPPMWAGILAGFALGAAYAWILWPMFAIGRKGPRA